MKRIQHISLFLLSILSLSAYAQFDDLKITQTRVYSCSEVPDVCPNWAYYWAGNLYVDTTSHIVDIFQSRTGSNILPLGENGKTAGLNDYGRKFGNTKYEGETYVQLGDRLYCFVQFARKDDCDLLAYEVDMATGKLQDEGTKVLSNMSLFFFDVYSDASNYNAMVADGIKFQVERSSDGERVLIHYKYPGWTKKGDENYEKIGYCILNKNLQKLASGSVLSPYPDKICKRLKYGFDSKNNVYIYCRVKGEKDDRYEVHFLAPNATKFQKIQVKLGENDLDDVVFGEDQRGEVSMYGFTYYQVKTDRSSDLFAFRIDTASKTAVQVMKQSIDPFYKENAEQIKVYINNAMSGNSGGFSQYKFIAHDIYYLADGSKIMIGTAGWWGGIFAMRINTVGEIQWTKQIYAYNSKGKASKVNYILSKDALYFVHTSYDQVIHGPWGKGSIRPKVDAKLSKISFDGKQNEKDIILATDILSVNTSTDHKILTAILNGHDSKDFELLKISLK